MKWRPSIVWQVRVVYDRAVGEKPRSEDLFETAYVILSNSDGLLEIIEKGGDRSLGLAHAKIESIQINGMVLVAEWFGTEGFISAKVMCKFYSLA